MRCTCIDEHKTHQLRVLQFIPQIDDRHFIRLVFAFPFFSARRAAVDVIPNLLCDGRYQRVLVEPLEVLSAAKGAAREAASRQRLWRE